MVGIPGNYLRVHGLNRWMPLFQGLWGGIVVTIAATIAYSMIRARRTPGDYGFSFRRGGLVSLLTVAGAYTYLVLSGKLGGPLNSSLLLSAAGAFMEEVGFRVILINAIAKLMDGVKGKGFWAILGSTILWSIPHIVTKTPAEFQGIVSGSLILGLIYYLSGSVLLPVWLHASANAGFLGGVPAAVLYCVLATIDWILRSRTGHLAAASGKPF